VVAKCLRHYTAGVHISVHQAVAALLQSQWLAPQMPCCTAHPGQPGHVARPAAHLPGPGSFRDRVKDVEAAAAAAVDLNAQITVRQSAESQSHTAGFEVGDD
jgi:hypothetical protein